MVKKINNYFINISSTKFIAIMVILSYALLVPLLPFYLLLSNFIPVSDGAVHIKESSFVFKILLGSIIVPYIETLIFQYGIINFLEQNKYLSKNKWMIISISGIAFSLSHTYDLYYVINTFIIGVLLAYAFVLYKSSPKKLSPFKVTFFIHAVRNTITTILLLF